MGEKNSMSKEDALELYGIFSQLRAANLSTYHIHIEHSRTLILAFLSASILAIAIVAQVELQVRWLKAVLMFLPIAFLLVNIWLCKIATEQCDRPYQIFLELITIQAKLEPIIGLVGQRSEVATQSTVTRFPQDKNIVPERWLEPGQCHTAKDFVSKYMGKGINGLTHQLFRGLKTANILLGIVITAIAILLLLTGSPTTP